MSKSREQINSWLCTCSVQDKTVIDLGVQDNPATKYVQGTPKLYKTLDVDPEWKPDFVVDLNEDINPQQQFDVVFCLETLEHVWNPVQAMQNVANLCKSGGVAYITTPFINPIHDKWDMLRYTDEWYRKVLIEVGFSHFEIKPRVATEGLGSLIGFYELEGLRMSKIRLKAGEKHKMAHIGYMIKAIK